MIIYGLSVKNVFVVNTAANCSFRVSNLPGQKQRINRLVPKDNCSWHGIVILRKPNIHCCKQPVTWKVMDRHLKSWFFAGYTRHSILVPKVKQLLGHLLETPWGTMKGWCFKLPKDNLHVLLTQRAQESDDCGFEEEYSGLKAYKNRNVQYLEGFENSPHVR